MGHRGLTQALLASVGLTLSICTMEPPRQMMLRFGNLGGLALTCESFRPNLAASFLRSGLLMYFCFWNIFSNALRCTSENTALRNMPLRGLPRAASGQEKVPGMGTTLEDAVDGAGWSHE